MAGSNREAYHRDFVIATLRTEASYLVKIVGFPMG